MLMTCYDMLHISTTTLSIQFIMIYVSETFYCGQLSILPFGQLFTIPYFGKFTVVSSNLQNIFSLF